MRHGVTTLTATAHGGNLRYPGSIAVLYLTKYAVYYHELAAGTPFLPSGRTITLFSGHVTGVPSGAERCASEYGLVTGNPG